jgi:TPR repeat protein
MKVTTLCLVTVFIGAAINATAAPSAPPPSPQAVESLRSRSEQGDANAMYEYAALLLAGTGVVADTTPYRRGRKGAPPGPE